MIHYGSATSAKAMSSTPTMRAGRLTRPRYQKKIRGEVVQTTSTAAVPIPPPTQVIMKTKPTCSLAVSIYPVFSYNAMGGGGEGTFVDMGNGMLKLTWDPSTLNIPDLNFKTTSIMGVPMPPPLQIAIQPLQFEGVLNTTTGQMEMEFDAQFNFNVGPFYKAPCLVVKTVLTTERSKGEIRDSTGARLQLDGSVRLVGVARVPKTGDIFVDTFLMLPTDALAVMEADVYFQ